VLAEMADLPDRVHGLDARGALVAEDYARVFAPLVDHVQRSGERFRLLLWFGPTFERITLGALWADSRLGARYISVMDGCALVTDIDWVREPARGIGRWLPCPMRVYDNAHREDAVRWLSALPAGREPTAAQTARAYVGGTAGATFNLAKLFATRRLHRR
jgi:hypothetical protein